MAAAAKAEAGSESEGEGEGGEDPAVRQAKLNGEIKRHLTQILLEVTDAVLGGWSQAWGQVFKMPTSHAAHEGLVPFWNRMGRRGGSC